LLSAIFTGFSTRKKPTLPKKFHLGFWLAMSAAATTWNLPPWIYPVASIATFAVAFGGIAIYSLTTGDHGQRLTVKTDETVNENLAPPNEDQYWKGGLFYYNPSAPPTLWVPKRFSGGYTVNAGHPIGKLIYIGIILLVLALILF
jgi:uncharacterized membrane protein